VGLTPPFERRAVSGRFIAMSTEPSIPPSARLPRPDWPREPGESPTQSRNLLELVLAAGGVAAWLWCAYQVARALFR
jgi:hypothetical protein